MSADAYAERMNETQGPPNDTPLCDACLEHLTRLLNDWHMFADVLSPLITEDLRVRGHLMSVIEHVDACRAGRHHVLMTPPVDD